MDTSHRHPLYDDCECSDAWEHTQVLREADAMDNSSRVFNDAIACGQIYPNTPQVFFPPVTEVKLGPVVPEIYQPDLDTLSRVMDHLGNVAAVSGVFDIEFRVKLEDGSSWVVIGYGESGDPAILRFESA